MKTHRRLNYETPEIILKFPASQKNLVMDEVVQEKLVRLRAFICQLEQTPSGMEELARRIQLFGECKRHNDESDLSFHNRLRSWLDKDMPDPNASDCVLRLADGD